MAQRTSVLCLCLQNLEDPDDPSYILDPRTLAWCNKEDEQEPLFIRQWRANPKRIRLVYDLLDSHFQELRRGCTAHNIPFQSAQVCLVHVSKSARSHAMCVWSPLVAVVFAL